MTVATDKQLIHAALDHMSEIAGIPSPRWRLGNVAISYFDHFTRTIIFSKDAMETFAKYADPWGTISLAWHEWKHWWQHQNGFCQDGGQCGPIREIDAVDFVNRMILTNEPERVLDRVAGIAVPPVNKGACFRDAGRYAIHERGDGEVVHGKVNSIKTGTLKRIDHAWVEFVDRGELWEPQYRIFIPIKKFYEVTEAEPYARYTTEEAAINSVKYAHWGPWP